MKKSKLIIGGIITGLLGISLGLFLLFTLPANILTLDINPSIEITTNRLNNVLSIEPLNQEAKDLLSNYTLRDKNLNHVVNDLTDLMILTGYITGGEDNMIMITVKEDNADPQLLTKVNDMIAAYLENKQIQATLFNQSISYAQEEINQAKEFGISPGRMDLIQKLLTKDGGLAPEALATISLKELLVTARGLNMEPQLLFSQVIEGLNNGGNIVSDKGEQPQDQSQDRQRISLEKAREIALNKVNGQIVEYELEKEKNGYKYEFKIHKDNKRYEIEIDAQSGKIVEFKSKTVAKNSSEATPSKTNKPSENKSSEAGKKVIPIGEAEKIASKKVNGQVVELELEKENGRIIYEVKIHKDGKKYEMEIDAYTGKILEIESKTLPSSEGVPQDKNIISLDKAKEVALKEVKGEILEYQLEREKGGYIYEFKILKDGKKYEVEIDAISGKVLKVELD